MDSMSVTFNLIAGLRRSDSTPLTASDSVYSYLLAADPDTPTDKFVTDRTGSYLATSDTSTVWTGLPGYLDATYYINF